MAWLLKYHWAAPAIVLVLAVALLVRLDDQQRGALRNAQREAAAEAELRASSLADDIGNVVSSRIGALSTVKIQFTQVRDSISEASFFAAVDSATRDMSGLTAVSLVFPGGEIQSGNGAFLGRPGIDIATESSVRNPYARAIATMRPAATALLDLPVGRRVFLFDPVVSGDSSQVLAVAVGEVDPGAVLRAAIAARSDRQQSDPVASGLYVLYAPPGVPITTVPLPRGWPTIDHPIRVADIDWTLRFAYQPVDERAFNATRLASLRLARPILRCM